MDVDSNISSKLVKMAEESDMSLDVDSIISSKMIKIVEESGNRWQCSDCEYSSPYTTSVKRHIESKHVAVQFQLGRFPCEVCGQSCPTRNALSVHKRRNHQESNPKLEDFQFHYVPQD